MQVSRKLEQQIAVFGESGSGKTVLLSSFYGATQEPHYLQNTPFNIVADDIGQGNRLHKNYLGMRESARLPEATRFAATSYSFTVKLHDNGDPASRSRPFDAVRLVWHDYPGEWFEQDVSGDEEAQRRLDTFRTLLGSDVAFLLVDGQKLRDNAGEEERYLKSLFTNFRNGILNLKEGLLQDGKPLVEFPRIWMLALSKSDLLPELNVFQFRDLIVEKACDEVAELRKTLAGMIEGSDALSVGEDFILLSSAKFEPGRIQVTERVGVKFILPLAAMLPFERHVQWQESLRLPGKVAENLVAGLGLVGQALTKKAPARLSAVLQFFGPNVLSEASRLAGEQLRALNQRAREKRDSLTTALTQFKLDLEEGEKEQVLLRSRR